MQDLTLAAITATKKCTAIIQSKHDKVNEVQNLGQGHRVMVHA